MNQAHVSPRTLLATLLAAVALALTAWLVTSVTGAAAHSASNGWQVVDHTASNGWQVQTRVVASNGWQSTTLSNGWQ